jgi:hypothetical protein
MIRPRFTLARIALAGAGLLTAAGIGAAAVPQVLASSPAAATTTSPTPKAGAPAAGQPGAKAKRHHAGLALHRELVGLVAKQTGLTLKQVRADLKAGKSLDTIAGAKAQAVRDAALDAVTKRLDAARAKGKITQAQETRMLEKAKVRIATLMAATPHPKTKAAV